MPTKLLITKHKHMPVQGSNVVAPEGKEWDLIPKDVYQVEVLDIELKEGTKYQSDEKQTQLVFTFVLIEEGEHYGRRMWQYASQTLSKFKGGSNLYKTIVGLNGGVQLTDEQCSNIDVTCSDEALNALIGKQVRLSIGDKAKQDGTLKNIIESYLPIKEELPAFDATKMDKLPAQDKTVEEIVF